MPTIQGMWVRKLRSAQPVTAEPVCLPETIAQAVRQVGQPAVDWAVNVGHEMAVRAIAETPEFGAGEDAVRLLRYGTESAVIRTMLAIDAGEPQELGATPESVDMMHEYVHRRMPLEKIWDSVRHGHSWLADYYMSACLRLVDPAEQPGQLQLISKTLFDWVNAFSSGIGDLFHEEEERWVSSAAAARTETLRALLSGEQIDPAAASSVLRYDLAHLFHVGLVLCQQGKGAPDATALHRIASDALAQLGATRTLIVPVGRTELWAWGSAPGRFAGFDETVAGIDLRGAHAVAGAPARGLAGFRRTHLEAQEAARVVLLTAHRSEGLTTYSSVSLLAALTANPDLARKFMLDELGALAGNHANEAALRSTLLSYLENGHSPSTTAARLFVAKNTVAYRVKRAEELLGRPADERELELWCALRLAAALIPAGRPGDDKGTSSSPASGPPAQPPTRAADGPASVTALSATGNTASR